MIRMLSSVAAKSTLRLPLILSTTYMQSSSALGSQTRVSSGDVCCSGQLTRERACAGRRLGAQRVLAAAPGRHPLRSRQHPSRGAAQHRSGSAGGGPGLGGGPWGTGRPGGAGGGVLRGLRPLLHAGLRARRAPQQMPPRCGFFLLLLRQSPGTSVVLWERSLVRDHHNR